MSTNPRDVVARIVDPRAWEERMWKLERLEHWRREIADNGTNETRERLLRINAEMAENAIAPSLAKADAILSALQPAVTDEAVEAATRAIANDVGIRPFDHMALDRPELRQLVRSADGYDINEPTQTDCRLAARAALTAALPFMMGERT